MKWDHLGRSLVSILPFGYQDATEETQASGSSLVQTNTWFVNCHHSLASGELPAYAGPGSSPRHSNSSVYFRICNLLQQLLVSFQMSYSEDIND